MLDAFEFAKFITNSERLWIAIGGNWSIDDISRDLSYRGLEHTLPDPNFQDLHFRIEIRGEVAQGVGTPIIFQT